MSGFDVMMRSQELASRSNQFYDAQRYESMRQTGDAVQQLGQFSAELGMQQTEQAMRIASFEQEWQANQIKLQGMQALDQTALSREAVRGAKLQNDAMQMDMDAKKKAMSDSETRTTEQTKHWVRSELGGLGLAELGYHPVTLQKFADEGEQKEAIEGLTRAETVTGRGRKELPAVTRDRIGREVMRLRAAIAKENENPGPGQKERIKELQRQVDVLDREYSGMLPDNEPEPEPEAAAEPQRQSRTPYNNDRRDQLASQIASSFVDKSDPVLGPLAKIPDQESRLRVGYALASLADRLVEHRGISADQAPMYVMAAAKEDPVLIGYALQVGGYSDERIRAYLRATNAYDSDSKLDNAMRRLKDQNDILLRPFHK